MRSCSQCFDRIIIIIIINFFNLIAVLIQLKGVVMLMQDGERLYSTQSGNQWKRKRRC